jgi:dolichyl-phosphate-mannose--protein O-mannosyl transferase
MNAPSGSPDPQLLSYRSLRRAIGYIGIGLPFALALGEWLTQGSGIQESVSAYYYTDMRNLLVGSLCAIAVFLMTYRGFDNRDLVAGRLACAFAIGVAFFPTTPPGSAVTLTGALHLTSATLLFLTLAFFCWFLFTETDPRRRPTPQKLQRNKVYRACAIAIVVCIALVAVIKLSRLGTSLAYLSPVFWLEAAAILSFGASWLIKGETLLKDAPVASGPA